MSFKDLFFSKKDSLSFLSNATEISHSTISNPYVSGAESRKEWNDRYMNMSQALRNWQIAFLFSMVICVILLFIVAKIATESHVEPYIVETNNGMPYDIRPMDEVSIKDLRIVNFAVNQFIENARTVLADSDAEANILNKVYAFSADDTLTYLKDYYQANNPSLAIGKYTVSVNIINSMPIGKNVWQITWDEIKTDSATGQTQSKTRWMANLTYKFGEINKKFMKENPFGLYITQISWSQSQTE